MVTLAQGRLVYHINYLFQDSFFLVADYQVTHRYQAPNREVIGSNLKQVPGTAGHYLGMAGRTP
jgi:hypothetical protein